MLDNPALVRDLVAWLCDKPRPYDEVSGGLADKPALVSRSGKDAVDAGLVSIAFAQSGQGKVVKVTDAGREFLNAFGESG